MQTHVHLQRLEIALLVALCLTLGGAVLPFEQECAQIRDKVIRLHVIANSNSAEDQAEKLRVRDRILFDTGARLQRVASRADAEALITALLPEIEQSAAAQLREDGYAVNVHAELTDMYFTTRTYNSGTMPAGTYRALRITIGEGAGENWWCVMFPPMCVSAALGTETDESSVQLEDVLTDGEFEIVTQPEKFEVRLKLVEWWTQLVAWLHGDAG